jgi:hypothetical protein
MRENLILETYSGVLVIFFFFKIFFSVSSALLFFSLQLYYPILFFRLPKLVISISFFITAIGTVCKKINFRNVRIVLIAGWYVHFDPTRMPTVS